MICRLCLITINVENKISIFSTCENYGESQIVKLIAKFFYLEITQHDSISTTLCINCWNHIDEFDKFCIYVNEKQNTLRNEFLEVKCDALQHDEVNAAKEPNAESLYGIKDVLQEALEIQLKCEQEEVNIFEETGRIHDDIDLKLSDDDIPLLELKRRCEGEKFKKTKKINPYTKIKAGTKIKLSTKTSPARNIKPAGKNRKPSLTSPSENKDNKFESKPQDEDGSELQKPIQFETNLDGKTTKFTKKKCNNKYPKKYPELSTEDKYNFISQNMQLKCDICDESFQKFGEVRSHFRVQHKCRAYIKCCDIRHGKLQDLFEHIKFHFDPEYFKCDTCGKLLKNSDSLDVHKLNYHLKDEDLAYSCKYCEKRFGRPHLLNTHMKISHEPKRPFPCQHCDKRFVLRCALTTHIQSMHENVFPYICDICGMKFKFKPSFEKHVLEHQGISEPRVQCPECGEWVKNKTRLRLHLTTHNKVDVQCKFCDRVCASLSAMRGHIQYMHRHLPSHKCNFCGKVFKKPKMLKEHVATHTGENLYNCPHCTKEFRSSANMYVHIKRQHTQEWLTAQVVRTKTQSNVENS